MSELIKLDASLISTSHMDELTSCIDVLHLDPSKEAAGSIADCPYGLSVEEVAKSKSYIALLLLVTKTHVATHLLRHTTELRLSRDTCRSRMFVCYKNRVRYADYWAELAVRNIEVDNRQFIEPAMLADDVVMMKFRIIVRMLSIAFCPYSERPGWLRGFGNKLAMQGIASDIPVCCDGLIQPLSRLDLCCYIPVPLCRFTRQVHIGTGFAECRR